MKNPDGFINVFSYLFALFREVWLIKDFKSNDFILLFICFTGIWIEVINKLL